jgi:hypothetical protein
LLNKDGGIVATMQRSLEKVREWLHIIEEHWAAVLDCIGLHSDDISTTRGVVILGRDKEHTGYNLRKLKWTFWNINFFTYDDILGMLINLTCMLNEL